MNARERDLRYAAIRKTGCICCRHNVHNGGMSTGLPVEIHHLNQGGKHNGKKRGDEFTIGLCYWHHKGSWNGLAAPGGYDGMRWMEKKAALYGPSWAQGTKLFRPVYGDDDAMLELTDTLIGFVRQGRVNDEPF